MVTEALIAAHRAPSKLDFAASWLARWSLCGGTVFFTAKGARFIHYPFRLDCDTHRSALRSLMGEFDDAGTSARNAVFLLASMKREGR